MNSEYKLVDLLDSICNILGITCKDVLQISTKGRNPANTDKLKLKKKIILAKSLFVYWSKFKYKIDNNKIMPFLKLKKESSLNLYYENGRDYSIELKTNIK